MKKITLLFLIFFGFTQFSFGQNAWINEIHYDNTNPSLDVNEGIEIIIENPGNYDLSKFLLSGYTENGTVYMTKSGNLLVAGDTEGSFITYYYMWSGIQNGPSDGIALSYDGNIIQFLSYEGSILATDGVASGITSVDIGVSETNTTDLQSLQLTGTGTQYSDFTWVANLTQTWGTANNGGTQVLPVQLTSFTAKSTKTGVMLNWTTATEINNYGFEIERSQTSNVKSETWEKVGFVEGHGNSNSPKEYSFFDNSGATSYRLKQVDFNGNYEYSDVVTVSSVLTKTELYQNSPNPFNPSTKISFSLAETGRVNVSVYNVIGQKVAELVNQTMESGIHNVDFNASNLTSGLYIYRLETPNYSNTMKMLLIK